MIVSTAGERRARSRLPVAVTLLVALGACAAMLSCTGCRDGVAASETNAARSDTLLASRIAALPASLDSACWAAYGPTHWNPNTGVLPGAASIDSDLTLLHRQGFDGLITYDANLDVASVAQRVGFKRVILGVWDPTSQSERSRATTMAALPVVIGLAVGNEGMDVRYSFDTLQQAIGALRQTTKKPVTTSEQIEHYADPKVIAVGDWLFPTVHAYFHALTDPSLAVEWTADRFRTVSARTTKPVLFKEVGLPSGGDSTASEAGQAEFYRKLSLTPVRFAWFEAFDQPWKNTLPVEPHWGIFRADRSPKPVAALACPSRSSPQPSLSAMPR
ncbi:MAG TPA: hypothetical protein VGM50_02485 [Gemmatimonadaceae bacterium]|jgi:exo-beta-1,3-glucanase (GH17 family)